MASCLGAAAIMLSNRVVLWNGKKCLKFKIVNFVGLIDFHFFTIKLPFGEIILEQISPYFGYFLRLFNFVVSFQKSECSIRNSFRNDVLHC